MPSIHGKRTAWGRIVSMDDPRRLPPGLRPPAFGDVVSLTWRADIGSDARVGDVGAHLSDLQTAVDLGERWGVRLAEAAALYGLEDELLRRGPESLRSELSRWPHLDDLPLLALDEWLHTGYWRLQRPGPPFGTDPFEMLRLLASGRVPRLLGSAARAARIEYRNPVEVLLAGSGFLLLGTIKVLTLIRDWSAERREKAAAADAAESVARQYASSAALSEWLVSEAMQGRQHVPIGDLVRVATPQDFNAMNRLVASDVSLDIPQGS